jgi:hypothetical protein
VGFAFGEAFLFLHGLFYLAFFFFALKGGIDALVI